MKIEYNKDGSFKLKQLESLYQKKPYSLDWHFHMSLPLTGKLTRPQFVERLKLGAVLGML